MPLQLSQNVFQEQGCVDSCQAHTRRMSVLSFSSPLGSKTLLATAFLCFLQSHLARNLVGAKASTFSALSVASSQAPRAPVCCGFSFPKAEKRSPRWAPAQWCPSSQARGRGSVPGTVTSPQGFAPKREASCLKQWTLSMLHG